MEAAVKNNRKRSKSPWRFLGVTGETSKGHRRNSEVRQKVK